MSFLRKAQASGGPLKPASSGDAGFLKEHPALCEYLTSETYPDGSHRHRSSVTVFSEDGFFKACLNEKDQGLVLFVAEASFNDLWPALELLLQADQIPWRKSHSKAGNRPRKS